MTLPKTPTPNLPPLPELFGRVVFYVARRWLCLVAVMLLAGCASMSQSPGSLPDVAGADVLVHDVQVDDDSQDPTPEPAPLDLGSEPRKPNASAATASASQSTLGAASERLKKEREDAFNPYVLTAHKHNFILPVSYSSGINESIYQQNDVPLREGLQPAEVKFQISLKSQLNEEDLFFKNDSLSLGITLEAWWQLYSSDLSSPFRETNYQPEVFYMVPLNWRPFGGNTALVLGFEHQSNGQVQGLSRSWNRLFSAILFERGQFVAIVRPWYRIPEKAKKEADAPEGDDNPDIIDFMGYGDVSLSWRQDKREYGVKLRANPSTGKGAVTIGVTFPWFAKFRGFVQYFGGYGDSLIDYDHHQQRLGFGVALSSLF